MAKFKNTADSPAGIQPGEPIIVDGVTYERYPIKVPRLIKFGEGLEDAITEFVKPHYKEGDWVAVSQVAEVRVVRDNRGDLNGELARAVAEEQVVEAVSLPRDQQQQPLLDGGVANHEGHPETLRDRSEGRSQLFDAGARLVPAHVRERDAHEEPVRRRVAELRAVDDVARAGDEEPETACTIPTASSQERVRMKSEPCGSIGSA